MTENVETAVNPRGRLPLFHQNELAECGLACMAMVSCYYGHDLDLATMRRRYSVSLQGLTLSRLITIGGHIGLDTRALRVELEALSSLKLPAIIHWDFNHFVVLKRITRKGVELHDPARGIVEVSMAEMSRHFTGVALELSPSSSFMPIVERQSVSIRQLVGRVTGVGRALLQVGLLALALEVFTLALPLALQWTLDHVLVSADYGLLAIIGIGFLGIVLLQAMLTAVRGWVVAHIGASLNSQWLTNLFGHLLRLPLSYFEKRSVGGVLSRFMSVQMIQQTLTGSFVEAVLDGLTVLLVLVLLAAYSPQLTLVVLTAVALYALCRWAAYRFLLRLKEEQLVYTARQQTQLIESIQGIQTIKLANKQSQRRARVENATVEVTNREASISSMTATFGALSKLVFGAQRIVVLWLAARMTLQGSFTAGMLVVFVAYAEIFATRIGGLIDKVVDFRLLGLHATRIADIALEQPEISVTAYNVSLSGHGVEVRRVSFRYGDQEPWVIRDCNLTITAGESVALIGPSGCGKTTLAKVLLGLLVPVAGEIRLGGIEVRKLGLDNYREYFGTVMQEDTLFAGSIADNITFFDGAALPAEVESAARAARIHEDIMRMPMGYESLVGDMGSALSGGQKQRVLLARALYRKPSILLLDEATSHLDLENEHAINRELSSLSLTRIIIAHRPDTILSADRILQLADGNITELSKEDFLRGLGGGNSKVSANQDTSPQSLHGPSTRVAARLP